jgi:predicted RNA-binding Zn-ribbon protein involved in translation (DUF1610 family)
MTIEFHCPHCDKLLKTADDKAGVGASCPGCGEPVVVPSAAESSAPDQSFSSQSSRPAEAGAALASSDSASEAADGEATRDCPMCGERIKAAATRCRYCGEDLKNKGAYRGALAAHRGGMILAFGIIGLVICVPFGIAAWVMGNNDLREIEAGRMDPSGEGLTRSGRIIGIIACCLAILGICVNVLVMVVALVANIH